MQFAPATTLCIRCKVVKMKTRGMITGMCAACRAADPAMAEVQRQNHALMAKAVNDMVMATSDPDPSGRPGIRKVRPGAIEAYFKAEKKKAAKRK